MSVEYQEATITRSLGCHCFLVRVRGEVGPYDDAVSCSNGESA